MKTRFVVSFVFVALFVGIACGFLMSRSNVLADECFWSGTANGMVVNEGETIEDITPPMQVAADSVGKAYYANGSTFNLKGLEKGEQTSLVLYVRNMTKKITNVYPIIESSPNLEVSNPLGNAKIYPHGWAQFTFVIRAVEVGPCSINIQFSETE